MKKKNICLALGLFAIAGAIALPNNQYRLYAVGGDASTSEMAYYVCFSNENYAIKNRNKMSKVDDHYELNDVDLTHSNSFYVTDEEGVRYYGADNNEIAVKDSESYAYNLYFSKDFIYDESHADNGIAVTNSHVSYAFLNKGSFAFTLNGIESDQLLTYSRYEKNYDAYTVDEIELNQNDVIEVLNSDKNRVLTSYTVATSGNYQLIYTPNKTINGMTYRFDKDGNYGSGDDYSYNIALKANDFYYVHYFSFDISAEEADATYEGCSLEKLSRDFSKTINTYDSKDHFVSDTETKIKYEIYQKVGSNFILIDDDNDSATLTSKLTATYPGWYHLSFSEDAGVYTTTLDKKDTDFKGYYLASGIGDNDFDENGNVAPNENREFTLIESDDSEYSDDYDQYVLEIYLSKEDLEKVYYITDGYDCYRNGDKFISFTEEGHYKMYFSKDHLYSPNQNYKFSLINDDPKLTYIKITSVDDFKKMIEDCNLSTTSSINKVYILTKDLSFAGVELDAIQNFHATFEGNYHSLSNIKIDESGDGASFIHRLEKDGVINNLIVEDFSITSDGSNLGFVSYNEGKLDNVSLEIELEGDSNIGGLVAHNGKYEYEDQNNAEDSTETYGFGTISNCTIKGKINGKNNVGGLVGYNEGRIYQSTNSSSINLRSYSSSESINNIGGIAGVSDGEIGLCVNEGKVGYEKIGNNVGGIAGSGSGLYFYETNWGKVSGKNYVGGIIGIFGSLTKDEREEGDEESSSSTIAGNLYYETNYGDISASGTAGGIAGYFNGENSSILNSVSKGDITLSSGDNAGGIVGKLVAGSVESSLSYSNISAKGTGRGNDVGGIAGYNAGKVNDCYSSCFLSGNGNVGGIVGELASEAGMSSNLSDCFISYTDEDISSFGHIVGEADDIYNNENVAYNYYVNSSSKIGGAGEVKSIGEEYDDKAAVISSEDLLSYESVSPHLNSSFAGEGWIGGEKENSYPYLRNFSIYKELESFSSSYNQEELYYGHQDKFLSFERENNCVSAIISYYEWNADDTSSKIDDITTYTCIDNIRVHSLSEVKSPEFAYAKDGVYSTDTGYYFVHWAPLNDTFESQAIYAQYVGKITSVASDIGSDFIAEGNFEEGTTMRIVYLAGDTYHAYFYLNGKDIQVKDFKLRIKTAQDLSFFDQDGNPLTSSRVGDYLVVNVPDSNLIVVSKVNSHDWPIYYVVAAAAIASLVIGFGLYFIIRGIVKAIKKHKVTKKKENR